MAGIDADILMASLEKKVIRLLDDDGQWDEDVPSLEDNDGYCYEQARNYLAGKRIDGNKETLAANILENFGLDEMRWDEDGEDDTPEFKRYVKKVTGWLEEFKILVKESKNIKKPVEEKEENAMGAATTLVSKVVDTVMDDSKEIAIRLGAQQLAKTVREPLAAMLIASLELEDSDSARAKVGRFLSSDVGLGLVSLACSVGVKSLPIPGAAQDVIDGLAKELRLQSEMAIATPVVELVSAPMRMLLADQILSLPIPGIRQAPQLPQNIAPTNKVEVKPTIIESVAEKQEEVKKVVKRAAKKVAKKVAAKVATKAKTVVKTAVKKAVKVNDSKGDNGIQVKVIHTPS